MTERVKRFLEFYNSRKYRSLRNQTVAVYDNEIYKDNPSLLEMDCFKFICENEQPLLYTADDLFGFNRYNAVLPTIVGYNEDDELNLCNVTIDYEGVLEKGISGIADEARELYEGADEKARLFYDCLFLLEQTCSKLVARYREAALKAGNAELAAALETVPMHGATDYYQALITLKFVQYILRLNRNKHVTIGRFDQYAKPYYDRSLANGKTSEELAELTSLWFISLNFDTDVYDGIQQGDNGQSMVLGGCDRDGNDAFNELSELCLASSEELMLIDPKINLRVNKRTPLSLYERGTKLTKQGLGFPQYSNDDVVIDGLVGLGYELEDARNYSVAACWEFIIPRCGADVPNVGVMNFPLVIERATKKHLIDSKDFDAFMTQVLYEVKTECDAVTEQCNLREQKSDPIISAFLLPCVKRGREVCYYGAKYNNYGIHGAGIATAADALTAIKTLIYDEKKVEANCLLAALEANFVGYEELQKQLLACPKMGNNEDVPDDMAKKLLKTFADNVNNRPNNRGGVFRAGSGSAMEYVLSAEKVGATADGRVAKAPYGSSFSPSLTTKLNGPLSAVQSFTKYDMREICNGGPFTIEIHDTVFRNDEGEKKVAQLVKTFIDLGGHQIQINAINRDRLLDAQKHPEKYPGLIVRVWGWSGYFNELEIQYQNHVIARTEFKF